MRISRRKFVVSVGAIAAGAAAGSLAPAAAAREALPAPAVPEPSSAPLSEPFRFTDRGHTDFGDWVADVTVSQSFWQPGLPLRVDATLVLPEGSIEGLARGSQYVVSGINVTDVACLLTAERTFDPDGWMRLGGDERMSTLLTPTGLVIEGGTSGPLSSRQGYAFRTPVDEIQTKPLSAMVRAESGRQAHFNFSANLPANLPPGIYRLRLDFGVVANKRRYSLNGEGFAQRPRYRQDEPVASNTFSPPVRASGAHAAGYSVDGSAIQPRFPWVILAGYNSNGYRGVVADEDKGRFALSERNIIPDEVILPLYGDRNNRLAYNLEPQFPIDTIDPAYNLPWDYASGEYSVQVTGPDGQTVDLGAAPFMEKRGNGPTTKHRPFTNWQPSAYGQYTVRATGWIADQWGNRYEGGGTYRFWVAKRMTMATATFQGQPYPVGGRYGRDIGFAPAAPADVTVTATLYPDSDPAQARSVTCSGKASPGGVFGAAQGMKPLPLDAPGEYHAHVLATYTDPDGHLWVCTMRHAGVVYPEDGPIMGHGKKLLVNKRKDLADRGHTYFEGYVEPGDKLFRHLDHIDFPYLAGDVLLIASENQGANKIEPVLSYEVKGENKAYERRLASIGATNIRIKTSNGYAPHMFPEYITDLEYYYAGAPRPGFMSRFLVGDDGVRAPYWPVSPNRFGGQVNTSANGDQPGDIYRLLGGVVLRQQGKKPMYAGYVSSAFILPKGTNNNRVVAPGSEDLIGADGRRARFFLTGLRPGMVYEAGAAFVPVAQIDPILPVQVRFTLRYPDQREKVWEGTGDRFGYFAGADRITLDLPGVYKYWIEAQWGGFRGHMPGLPNSGGEFYVIERERPEGAASLKISLPNQSYFPANGKLRIPGASSGAIVHYAGVIPGAVIAVGAAPVVNGRWEYVFDPAEVNRAIPTYDIVNLVNGKPEIGRVVHLTFFAREMTADGALYHDFQRVILRGTQVIVTR